MSLPHPDPVTADAFILAGGHSSRMGRDKALIPLAGHRSSNTHWESSAPPVWIPASPALAAISPPLRPLCPTIPPDPASGRFPASARRSPPVSLDTLSSFPPTSRSCPPALSPIFSITRQSPNPRSQSSPLPASLKPFPQSLTAQRSRFSNPALIPTTATAFVPSAKPPALSQSLFSVVPIELLLQSGQVSHPQGFPAALWFLNINSPGDLAHAETLFSGSPS